MKHHGHGIPALLTSALAGTSPRMSPSGGRWRRGRAGPGRSGRASTRCGRASRAGRSTPTPAPPASTRQIHSVFAYGIPQSRPATKMPRSAWPPSMGGRANPKSQIRWGLTYIQRTYGDPCAAPVLQALNRQSGLLTGTVPGPAPKEGITAMHPQIAALALHHKKFHVGSLQMFHMTGTQGSWVILALIALVLAGISASRSSSPTQARTRPPSTANRKSWKGIRCITTTTSAPYQQLRRRYPSRHRPALVLGSSSLVVGLIASPRCAATCRRRTTRLTHLTPKGVPDGNRTARQGRRPRTRSSRLPSGTSCSTATPTAPSPKRARRCASEAAKSPQAAPAGRRRSRQPNAPASLPP